MNPLAEYKISPEIFEVATEYVKHLNIEDTAKNLNLSVDQVSKIIDTPEVKRYIDAIFLEQGYLARHKLNDVMTQIIDMKLEEMAETGMGSEKDILELLKFAHQMRMDYEKINSAKAPSTQVNIQDNSINGGSNYAELMKKLLK